MNNTLTKNQVKPLSTQTFDVSQAERSGRSEQKAHPHMACQNERATSGSSFTISSQSRYTTGFTSNQAVEKSQRPRLVAILRAVHSEPKNLIHCACQKHSSTGDHPFLIRG
jgi:hypothetical protein